METTAKPYASQIEQNSTGIRVARLLFEDNHLTRSDFEEWYNFAATEPKEKAQFLQEVAKKVAVEIRSDLESISNRKAFLIGVEDELRERVRERLPVGQALLINADLALGAGGSTIQDRIFDRLIKSRMLAIIYEALHSDPAFLMGDLYLFRREELQAKEDSKKSDVRKIPVKHAFGAKFEKSGSDRDLEDRYQKNFERYPQSLATYLKECGTSISLDGHIDDRPVSYKFGTGTAKIASPDTGVIVSHSEQRELIAPRDESKIGDYPAFTGEVVPVLIGRDIGPCLLFHFMEGIDVEFSSDANRKGTVCHLFLIRQMGDRSEELDETTIRAIQRLLVRLCGFYAAVQAELERNRAERQTALVQSQAMQANREGRQLQAASKKLRDISQLLQEQIDTISELIVENYFLERFTEWLDDIVPLFDTGKEIKLEPTMGTVGHHTDWERPQLAAALWKFARPSVSGKAEGLRVSPEVAWGRLHAELVPSDFLENKALHLLHRLDRNFGNFLKISHNDVIACFSKFKSWKNGAASYKSTSNPQDRPYLLSEILFVLGEGDFLYQDDDETDIQPVSRFRFPQPSMFEALARFTSIIDQSVASVTTAKHNVPGINILGIRKIKAGIVPDSAAFERMSIDHPGNIMRLSFIRDREGSGSWIDEMLVANEFKNWLSVKIFQTPQALNAALKEGVENEAAAHSPPPEKLRMLFFNLFKKVVEKGEELATLRSEPAPPSPAGPGRTAANSGMSEATAGGAADVDANQDQSIDFTALLMGEVAMESPVISKSSAMQFEATSNTMSRRPVSKGSEETSTALAEALGLFIDFVAPEHQQTENTLRRASRVEHVSIVGDASAGWAEQQPIIFVGSARGRNKSSPEWPVAIVSADLKNQCLEVLIAPEHQID